MTSMWSGRLRATGVGQNQQPAPHTRFEQNEHDRLRLVALPHSRDAEVFAVCVPVAWRRGVWWLQE
jgi:hypothetical protein